MPIHLNVNGSWREGNKVYVRVAGSWVEADELFVRQAGVWSSAWRNEIVFVNNSNRTAASIFELMGSPSVPGNYIFENTATISAASRGGWALQTGVFPAGSTLTIINKGHIRGGGGDGGNGIDGAGSAGGTALVLNFPATIDNTSGTIWGGGGGGGGGWRPPVQPGMPPTLFGGGGGAGIPAGNGGPGGGFQGVAGANGTATAGGAGVDGDGGAPGAAGTARGAGAAGRGGYSVQTNGNAVTWIAVGDRRGPVV